jgi:hypothetical protein
MSKLAASLVLLANAVSAAVAFPHQPVPETFAARIADAAKAVEAAANDASPSVSGEGAQLDLSDLAAHLIGDDAFRIAVIDGLTARVQANDLAALVIARLEANDLVGMVAKKLEKAVSKDLGKPLDDLTKSVGEIRKAVEDLEAFAEAVEGDLGPRLKKLEDALGEGDEGSSGDKA